MIYVAVLGYGTVGSGVVEVIEKNKDMVNKKSAAQLEIKYILDLRDFPGDPYEQKVVHDVNIILEDPEVSIICETMGGVKPAYDFTKAALLKGKSVCTSNKELVATHGPELLQIAREHSCNYLFEASVGGGIPIIRPLNYSLTAEKLEAITGILNGTTNYILTKMSNGGAPYGEVLDEAKRLGYAEADPTSDVDGYDAAYKLSILSSLAFHTKVPYTEIYREGISEISTLDIAYGKQLGYVLKLLAIGKNTAKGIEVRVHPAFIKAEHPLASVNDSYNAVYLTGDSVEDVMLYGRGAGAKPTGSAIVGDIIYCATHSNFVYSPFENTEKAAPSTKFIKNFESAYYLRIVAADKAGVLSKVTSVFGKLGISMSQLIQEKENSDGAVPLVVITHETYESNINKAVAEINSAAEIAKVAAVIRVVA